MTYPILAQTRKELAKRIQYLTGYPVEYAAVPTFAYHIGAYTLHLRTMEVENPDALVINNLMMEGLIGNPIVSEPQNTPEREDDAEEAPFPQPTTSASETTENMESENKEDNEYGVAVSAPIDFQTYESLTNLINTIYTRGKLLSKSTGGFFFAGDELVKTMRSGEHPHTLGQAIHIITEANAKGELSGIRVDDDKLVFDFGKTNDANMSQTFIKLTAFILESCHKHRRIIARRSNDENEKFAMRVWLTRLGMDGPEYKHSRNILYRNLTGHTAFRTQASAERWKEKHQTKG